jgi:REP element-mobilizing transposase RayT
MGLGQLRGPSWLTDPPRNCPNQISIVTRYGSYVNGFRSITISSSEANKAWSEQKRVAKLRYIHRNPVKRGLVERPEDWFCRADTPVRCL